MEKSTHHKITPTADLISYFRIFSDTPFTKEIAEMTNAKEIVKNMLKENFESSNYIAVMAEARYKKINLVAKKYKNILEVAVGRSPRDLIFTEDSKINYVATDLPDSLKNHELIMGELMKKHKLKRPNLHFAVANALNFKELDAAGKILPIGEIAIISEGMLVYFSKEEKKVFLENVHKILKKRGGVLVTSDIMVLNRNTNNNNKIQDNITKTSGRDMRDCNFDSEEEIQKFVQDCGFEFELFNPQVDLVSMKSLRLEENPAAQRMANMPIRILKVKENKASKTL